MPALIEDYALIGDCRTAALVSRDGSVDWLCAPRFDSASVFAALLGTDEHGAWSLRPTDADARCERRYDGDTFTLVTRWTTTTGVADVYDLMPIDRRQDSDVHRTDLLRRIVGVQGTVTFTHCLRMRFEYARSVPWVRQAGHDDAPALIAIAGPDALVVRGPALRAEGTMHDAQVVVGAGAHADASLTWYPSHRAAPPALDVDEALAGTGRWWRRWIGRADYRGPHRDAVVRSLMVLRALSHYDTGGIVAAVTTSLPEQAGGARNWDYRYVWLRDASLTLQVLLGHGFLQVAEQWRSWLLRAVAGTPGSPQIMYGPAGERYLPEREIPWLPGYEGAAPVRVGNGAVDQHQADVIGEVLVALDQARQSGLAETRFSWSLQRALVDRLLADRDLPDNGLWEMRGRPRMFTHSRVMMWAGLDAAIRGVRRAGLDGPVDEWISARDGLRAEIDREGVSPSGHFVQAYGADEVDAALLVLPQVGYCSADDPRMLRTVARIEHDLMRDGLVLRYRTDAGVDGLFGDENPFLACSFWLVEQYAASGRVDDAAALIDRLCALRNDLGLLSEEYDTRAGRQLGNTPQAFSHLTLVRAADALAARQQ